MIRQHIITLIAATAIASQAGNALIEGYVDTKWGQSQDEVMAAVPNLKLIKGDPPVLRQAGAKGDMVQKIEYAFLEDKLIKVSVYLKVPGAPEDQADKDGLRFLKERLAAKYGDVKQEIAKAGIMTMTRHGGPGVIIVAYSNVKIQREITARDRAAAEAAQEKRYHESDRYRIMSKSGIDERL